MIKKNNNLPNNDTKLKFNYLFLLAGVGLVSGMIYNKLALYLGVGAALGLALDIAAAKKRKSK